MFSPRAPNSPQPDGRNVWVTDPHLRIIDAMAELSHLDESGAPRMVDVSEKPVTLRKATAHGAVHTNPATIALVTSGTAAKGDVLTTARLAGIIAAKRTAELIPLTHPLPLTAIEVELTPDEGSSRIDIEATVTTSAQTGVEMEALTAVSIAALTVYDMLKSSDRAIRISDIELVSKSGGQSGDYVAAAEGEASVPDSGDAAVLAMPGAGWTATRAADEVADSDEEAGTTASPWDEEERVPDTAQSESPAASAEGDELSVRPWPGVIPTVTAAESSREFEDPSSTVAVTRSLTLQTGATIEDASLTIKSVYEGHPELAAYDLQGVAADDSVRSPEIDAAAPLIPGFTSGVVDLLARRDPEISHALSQIPARASLTDSSENIPWSGVRDLIAAAVGPGVGLSRATKILHKKRPALVPVIDEPIVRYAMRIDPNLPAEPADSTVRIMQILKEDLDRNLDSLERASEDVDDVALTPLRVLDLCIRSL
jgi:cyclic pyranopterin phosphate synthase